MPRTRFLVPVLLLLAGLMTPAANAEGGRAFDVGPAARALERLLPRHHNQVELSAVSKAGHDFFRISGRSGRVKVEGTSPAVLLTGVNTYLKEVVKADISWGGDQLNLSFRLPAPAQPIERQANVAHRFALNDTNDGYTGPYRDWQGWEREIDVLALHGINEVLVYLGQDEVYYRTFRDFGYSDEEIRAWIPAPAHQPWWLLQNMSGFGGPISRQLLDQRTALAKKIVNRLRELGMTPVFPGYFGTVPTKFAEHNPGAHLVPQGKWGGFDRPDWLDPRDPHFARVAESFYRHQSALYGDSSMYKMDLLHEGGNPGDVPVGEAAQLVERALRTAHPEAIWAILGWQNNPRPEMLDAVDKDRMFIVDGLSDRYTSVTDREKDWHDTPYAFGSIWNFGGHTAIGANTPDWVSLYPQWRDKPGSKLSGIAMMPEAAGNNHAAMDLLTDLAWTPGSIDLTAWFDKFAESRYGAADPQATAAWRALRKTAYEMSRRDSWSEAPDGLFGARPNLAATKAASWGPENFRYDPVEFDQALTGLLQVNPRLRGSAAYRYDLVDVARQVLSNRSRLLLPEIKAAYDAKDRRRFGELTGTWMRWMGLLDRILGTNERFLLGPWLADARAQGRGTAEKDQLEFDARSIITVWGDRASSDEGLHDYANREWAGLVGDFYAPRWQRYFTELGASLAENRAPRPIDWFAHEDAWTRDHGRFPVRPTGDSYAVAQQIVWELATDPHQAAVTATADQGVISPERPITVTASFVNRNGFAPARDARLSLGLPAGLTAEPLTPTGDAVVAPGETVTVKWKVSITGTVGGSSPVASLPVTAAFRSVLGRAGSASATTRVMAATGVTAPHRTASFNEARFGQAGTNFAIEGAGADLWGGTNEFGTIYLDDAWSGDATATTQVVAQDRSGNWARAGLIVRNDLTGADPGGYLNLAVTPANGCVLTWDGDGDGRFDSVRQLTGFAAPVHLRLTRTGGNYTAECGPDGRTWQTVGTATPAASAPTADIGLFMTAANGWTGTRGIAEFADFRLP